MSSTTPPTIAVGTNAGVWFYTEREQVFADGFESGDTSAWTMTVD